MPNPVGSAFFLQLYFTYKKFRGGEYNSFIYAEGRIPLETSILSGRLNIVQTDREKGIIRPLPSPPTFPSKPSGSHLSVTTEERNQSSTTLLLTNRSLTQRPPLCCPSQVSSSSSLSFSGTIETDEEWMSESGSLFISQRQGNAKGLVPWNPLFCLSLGERPLGVAQGGIQSEV